MKALADYIAQFGQLDPQQLEMILAKAAQIELHKNEYFSEAGKISHRVGFITDGIVRVIYYTDKGDEVTKYFIDENNLVVDLESFDNEIPSVAYVEAVTDCRLLVFSRKDWQELLKTVEGWETIVHKIISKALRQKVERRSPLVSEDATTRYKSFLDIYPNVINRVPLAHVASYLGITQSSLSRIRKEIRDGNKE